MSHASDSIARAARVPTPWPPLLAKELKRRITVDGAEYTVVLDPDGVRLVGKGKRKPEVELRWREMLSGDAAMAAALNASLGLERATPAPVPAPLQTPAPPAKRATGKR